MEMDKAIIGYCRIGYFRIGVFRPDWDRILERFQNIPARTAGGKTPCIQGVARQGMTRHNVYIPLFDEVLENLKKAE